MVVAPRKYLSPTVLMLIVWGIEIFLYNLHIISFYNPLNIATVFLLFGVIFSIFCAGIFVRIRNKQNKSSYSYRYVWDYNYLNRINIKFLKIFVYGTIINIIFSRGFPLMWLFTGDPRTYANFGVPSLSGFLNSFYFVILLNSFYLYSKTKDKHYLKIVLLIFIYPFMLMQRSLIIISVLELAGLFLLINRIKIKHIIGSVVLALAVILVFGYMGDNRYGEDGVKDFGMNLVDEKYKDTMEKYPSGFIWGYLYFTVSLNNVIYNINKLQPTYTPYYTIRHVLPNVISNQIYEQKDYDDNYSLEMEVDAFNTFTIYSNYIKDFGVFLTIIIFFFVGILFYSIYFKATEDNLCYLYMYPPIFMIICLSVFDDFLLWMPIIFQLILTKIFIKPKQIIKVT